MVVKYYSLDKKEGRIIAHSYIESGVDILLLTDYPSFQKKFKQALRQVHIKKLSELLEIYFNIDQEKFYEALTQFIDLFTKYDFSKTNNWVLFWKDLEILLSLKNIGDKKRKELLDMSLSIVKNTYKDFLVYSQSEGLKEINEN